MSRTVSQYFNQIGSRNEQRLVEDLLVESIRISGLEVFYLPKTLVALDALFGEDPQMAFEKAFPIEMYFDNPTGFDGDRDIISKLGLELRSKANFICSRRRFSESVSHNAYNAVPQTQLSLTEVRPMEGDLIYLPVTNDIFTIQYADHESVFHQLGGLYLWRITVQKFDYSHEQINTGVPEIDRIQDVFDADPSFSSGFGQPGFAADDLNDPIADNNQLKTESNIILDFTETNPFGEPNRN